MRARMLWSFVLAFSTLLAEASSSCARTHAAPAPAVARVGCIGLTVSDLARSEAFYRGVLGFVEVARHDDSGTSFERLQGVPGARARTARLQLGAECLELTQYVAAAGRPAPPDARSNDRWFQHVALIVSDMDTAYAHLQAAGVQRVSPSPQRLPDWNRAAAGIRAFYFLDPDRHVLEVLQFPPGKGDARWHASAPLFLGIDHTAIVVADTDASVRFYRGLLGLEVAGTSENFGPEQEALNAVPGAHLRITTLRSAAGPGIELLEYLSPRDGRAYPAGERASDLVHWQTALVAPDVQRVTVALRNAGARLVSEGVVEDALIARDPDGHALRIAAEQ